MLEERCIREGCPSPGAVAQQYCGGSLGQRAINGIGVLGSSQPGLILFIARKCGAGFEGCVEFPFSYAWRIQCLHWAAWAQRLESYGQLVMIFTFSPACLCLPFLICVVRFIRLFTYSFYLCCFALARTSLTETTSFSLFVLSLFL